MFYKNKYFMIITDTVEDKPILYLDFYKWDADLRRSWRDNSYFHFEVGIFGKMLMIRLKWGYKERERNEREEDTYQRVQKFIKDLQ